jgi:hypothetical protein
MAGGSLSVEMGGSIQPGLFAFWSLPQGAVPGGHAESLAVTASECGSEPGQFAFVIGNGWPPSACNIEQLHRFGYGGVGWLWIWLECNGSYAPGCAKGPSISAHYIATTEVDPDPPTLTDLRGSLLGQGVIRGHQSIGVDADDVGGGLSSITVAVNNLPAAPAKLFNCNVTQTANESVDGTVAASLTPCPGEGKAEWTLDTEEYPFHNGNNNVSVCAADFSTIGDPNTTCESRTVHVDNTCTPTQVDGGESLSAGFAGSDAVVVPYGKAAAVQGRLSDAGGDPVPGATLCVKMQTLETSAKPSVVGTVQTDAEGRYRYEVKPGPDRELMVGYRHDSQQLAREVDYYSHSCPTLKLYPPRVANGERIRMWGHLPEPHAGRRVIVLQASALGSNHWLTFRRATSDRSGRFRASYRFNDTPSRTTYRIRAISPRQAGYPYLEGHSKPARVEVSG